MQATCSDKAALTEGFALDPSGFDSIVFTNGLVEVVPEPATGLLFAGALVALGLIGRARS
jgi:hypothetical protein